MVFGVRVITSPTGTFRKSSLRSIRRVRSPAVNTPASSPCGFTTVTVPRFSASNTMHSRIGRSGVRVGRSLLSITSRTRSNSFRLRAPPGWSAAKSSRRNPLTSSRVTASASPRASATVVLVVGASVSGHASSARPASSTTVAACPSVESGAPVRATIGTPSRFNCSTSPNSSSDSPLFDRRIATSSRPTMPRSPCSESTGCRNAAGVPVDVNVAAIFRAMSPDFPTPETMSRPEAAASRAMAWPNAAPSPCATCWIASASRASTRRPRSARSGCALGGIAPLLQILVHGVVPNAAGRENRLRDLSNDAVSTRALRDERGDGGDFGDGVGDGYR